MADFLQFALVFVGIPAGLLVVYITTWGLEWMSSAIGATADHCHSRLSEWRHSAAQKSAQTADREDFFQWLGGRMGADLDSGRLDDSLIDAQHKAQFIRPLVEEEIPKQVHRCLETHRMMAKITGAVHLAEIAFEPECHGMRARTVWLLAHGVRFLESYPLRLDDPRLLHNSLVLRKRALPTCRRCPYIQLPMPAPGLCPTAELVQLKQEPM